MRISQTEILDELRKFVEANGEVPGERTFSVATGIKTSTWKGVYWVRWTDAVREAGYDPNSLQQRIPDDELLVKLCTFVTELGRFPAKDEFRLHARNTLGFPSWTTIKNRYGGMLETATALLAHSQTTNNKLLERLCLWRIESEPKKLSRPANGRPIPKIVTGFVYLKYSPSLRLYKIGKANNPKKRGSGLSLLLPEDLIPKHDIKTDYPYILEKYWEYRFREKKKQGEWYALNAADIKAFKSQREFFSMSTLDSCPSRMSTLAALLRKLRSSQIPRQHRPLHSEVFR